MNDRLSQAALTAPENELDRFLEPALAAARALLDTLQAAVHKRIEGPGRGFDDEQAAAHGLAWTATQVRALQETLAWYQEARQRGATGPYETALTHAAFAEYLAQIGTGIALSPTEIFRPETVLETAHERQVLERFINADAVQALRRLGFGPANRAALAQVLAEGQPGRRFGIAGDGDPLLGEIRTQFARYADDHAEAAHGWHLRNELIPESIIRELGALGVFGLTVPETLGGSGLGKAAMCVVTEELSRSFIGLGSLGTRSEIACELLIANGTEAQRKHWLPGLVSGQIIPAAAFTEPDAGSDLASLRTRAEPAVNAAGQPVWRITGNKTWTTHGARSDMLTLLARTDPGDPGHRGLSMFLVPKPRGSDANPFPAPGLSGSEIQVLGYRGMKEYEIAFDGYEVPRDALLGGTAGQGFRQLMQTFESARIQTAARAVGVAQNALELGLDYALSRKQFGRSLIAFPRVADKLAWMAVETQVARQLTLAAARAKDSGRRCDVEAGMAKLLAARVAWTNADCALQIHGGNGYAQEYPISRVLVDARILSIFEGAAEIQAHIIARGLLRG